METTILPQCWQDVTALLGAGVDRVILYGPPGTGKTYAGLTLGVRDVEAHRLICTEDMTAAEITGCWMPADAGSWQWLEGQAVKAWQGNGTDGARLVVDEIDRANGDAFALLLAMTDTVGSAKWEHPATGTIVRPNPGFSVVMTTNVEDLRELPEALLDRFPVRVRIDAPHPDALKCLRADLRPYAAACADLGDRRISVRTFMAFDQLRGTVGDAEAARLVFGDRAEAVLDAIAVDKVAAA